MAVVWCDFQNNILSAHKRTEQKMYVLRFHLHVHGCLQGAHTDDQTTSCQTHQGGDVRREKSPGVKLEQTRLPSNLKKEAPANPSPQPHLVPSRCRVVPLWKSPLPSPSQTELPTIPCAAHACILFWGRTTAGCIPACTK